MPDRKREGTGGAGGEFDLIRRHFAPLAAGEPGAFGLMDDAAVLLDTDFIVTKDLLVAGVHFPSTERLDCAARKALRANLSDLAAKGARPFGYFLGCVWPAGASEADVAAFASGLADDQRQFRCALLGGDTTVHRAKGAPFTISITMIGLAPRGSGMIRRSGARPGDDLWVTGTIGDAGLGLRVHLGEETFPADDAAALLDRFRAPSPRVAFGGALAGVADASIDVSDGLLADAGHLAAASGVRLEITSARVPLSAAAGRWRDRQPDAAAAAVSLAVAGDDYEILFTAPPERRRAVEMAAQVTKTAATRIGQAKSGEGVKFLDARGAEIKIDQSGYDHFRP